MNEVILRLHAKRRSREHRGRHQRPGTTSAEEAFNKLYVRVRNIENMVEEISNRA
jgi:hypothetical protein